MISIYKNNYAKIYLQYFFRDKEFEPLPEYDEGFKKLLLMEIEWTEFVDKGLFGSERIELQKVMDILHFNSYSIAQFIISNQELFHDFYNNLSLSVDSLTSFFDKFTDNNFEVTKENCEALKILGSFFDKFFAYLYTKEETPNLTKLAEIQTKRLLIEKRFVPITSSIKVKEMRTKTIYVKDIKNIKLNVVWDKLKTAQFINKNSDLNSFEMIFAVRKVSKSFNQINWIGSIAELKRFINIMQPDIHISDNEYLWAVMDCFLVKNKQLKHSQILNPTGSARNFEKLEEIVSSSKRQTPKK